MIFFIILLAISQLISFYLIFNKIKPIVNTKPKGIFLRSIPDKPTYESLDKDYKLVYDVIESARLENWEVNVKEEVNNFSKVWSVNLKSTTGVHIMSRIRMTDSVPNLSTFIIANGDRGFTNSGSISAHMFLTPINNESKIANDIIIFLWDYIIEYYQSKNEEAKEYYKLTIDNISSKLKTLRRSERLGDILE